jgi:hypothetical protein
MVNALSARGLLNSTLISAGAGVRRLLEGEANGKVAEFVEHGAIGRILSGRKPDKARQRLEEPARQPDHGLRRGIIFIKFNLAKFPGEGLRIGDATIEIDVVAGDLGVLPALLRLGRDFDVAEESSSSSSSLGLP